MMSYSDNRTIPNPAMRSALLIAGLALATVAFGTPALAQSTPTLEPQAPDTPVQTHETTEEVESGPGACPCCGRGGKPARDQGAGQGAHEGRGGSGRGGGEMGRHSGGQGHGQGRPEARVAHFLIENHEKLDRTVEIIPGGVRTRTVSEAPEIVEALRTHVQQMADLIDDGGRIRNWDPLFREIFDHREAIEMEIVEIEGGLEVVETSTDEYVAQLIRAHAGKVEDFVARGIEAYREETALPEPSSDTTP